LLRIADGSVRVRPEHQLVAPGSLRSHAQSLLYRSVRDGTLEREAALAQLERITEIKVRLLNDRVSRANAWRIAEQLDLPDTVLAEFLAVTKLQADALVTLDPELARLAEGVVELAEIEALGR
jgi:predicted nucleic acid-binding protein